MKKLLIAGPVILLCMTLCACSGTDGRRQAVAKNQLPEAPTTPQQTGIADTGLQLLINEYYHCKTISDSLVITGNVNKNSILKRQRAFYDSALASIHSLMIKCATGINGSCNISVRGIRYNVFATSTKESNISLHLYNDGHQHFISMGAVKKYMEAKGLVPLMITNAGIYDQKNDPIGLYIENGEKYHRLNMRKVPDGGNFYMLPNGVFYIDANDHAHIDTTEAYAHMEQKKSDGVKLATQSGPMLVINNRINSGFKQGSANINIRSGAGVIDEHKVVFAISTDPCNFYDFAVLFHDVFGCDNALYFDGAISRMYLHDINHDDTGGNFGGMIVVTGK